MKILIADDNEVIRRLAERVLRRAGHDAQSEPDGAAASARLGEGWDLVLSDLSMPGEVDGLELLRRARADSATDAILMTGHPDLASAIDAVRGGVYDYLIKPFGPEALLASVSRCEEKRRLSVELERERRLRSDLDRAHGQLKRLKSLRERFGQFVTPEVVHFILENPGLAEASGNCREATVLFADARGFTALSEERPPEEAVELMNEILTRIIDAVHAEGGVVNKFLGDGMMAVFGAPVPDEDHAAAAARAALRARAAVESLAESRRVHGRPFLRVGFGLESGEVIAGCLGSRERAEYTVMGRAVNRAKRLESAAEGGCILVGPGARAILEDFALSGRPMKVAGVAGELEAAELLGRREEPAVS